MIYPILDMDGNVVTPTIVLCHRNKRKLGAIFPISDWTITPDMNNKNECSFKVYKEVNGVYTPLWDKIKDLKVIYIPEYDEYFQIALDKNETNETVKTITASNLGIAELSQTILYDIEINTEDDIARDAYKLAYIYDSQDIQNSLLGRILSKASHYKIKHVDASLCKLVRSFSVNDKSIYDFLSGDLADELNCLVVVGSDRTVSLYDLENSCPKCGHRAENETVCSECGTTMTKGYGEDTNIFVSNDNLSDNIDLTTKEDEVKNTFRIQGSDDVINAAIRAVNPNGTEYINRFADFQLEDMSDELVTRIKSYQDLYESKKQPYKDIMGKLYETIDQILYLTSGMMPSPETDDTDANKELAKLTADTIGMVAVQNLSVAGVTTTNNAVKSVAQIYMSAGYTVDIASSTYSNQVWKGRFKVTSVDDEEDTATNTSDITILITDDYETFVYQKIKKILDKEEMSDSEEYDWTKYGLNRLSSFSDAYQSCLDVLIDMGVGDPSHEFYSSIYLVYYNKKLAVDAEIKVREAQIKEQEDKQDEYNDQRQAIQNELNFEKYLDDELYGEYCLYRREDTYQNDNYISDGLSNSELLSKAEELLEVANKEIYKSSELQVDVSTDIGNLFTIDEFKDVVDQWKVGNWIRIECDEEIYKVRLIDYTIKDSDFSKISCNFSSVVKVSNGISDVQSVLDSAKSMATSYESVKRQAKQSTKTTDTVKSWVDEGANATALAIKSSDNQEVIYDNHGIRCREYDDVSGTYADEQMQIVNNTLAITDDNWKTVKAAIGKIHYEDPEHPGDLLSAYGVLGETIVGKLLLGEALGIYNDGGSLKFNKNGLSITNGVNSFEVNPNDEILFSLSSNNNRILWVDKLGMLHIQGDGAGLDITSNDAINDVKSSIKAVSDEVVLKIDSNGRIASVKLGADAKDGAIVKIGADNINLTAEETINLLAGGTINLSGKNISITSDNFNLTKEGKMSCNEANINGNITANKLIANTSGTIAGFNISSDGLSISVSETLPTYTQADITRCQQIIIGLIQPTQEDYDRLDLNYDGKISSLDIVGIQRLINGIDPYNRTATFLLSPKSVKNTIKITDNVGGITTVGSQSISSNSVTSKSIYGDSITSNLLNIGHPETSNGSIKLITCGSCTCTGTGNTSVALLGVQASATSAFFLTNADASLSYAHIEGSQISGTTVYANLDRVLSSSQQIKINWVKFEW